MSSQQRRYYTRNSDQEQPQTVRLAWVFWDPGCAPVFDRIGVSPHSDTEESRMLFASKLENEYEFEADVQSIKFWAPKKDVSSDDLRNMDLTRDIKSFASRIYPGRSFPSELKGKEKNEDIIHVFITAERLVRLNWLFCNPNYLLFPHAVEVSRPLFKRPISYLKEFFAKELLSKHSFTAKVNDIKFYTPNKLLLIQGPFDEEQMDKTEIFPAISLSEALDNRERNSKTVHVIVIVTSNRDRLDGADDVPTELPECRRFERTFAAKGKSPSQAARSNEYRSTQKTEYEVMYDGRYAPAGQDTTAPPIYIYHRIFNIFRHLLQHPSQPTKEDIQNTAELMVYLCEITPKHESLRNEEVHKLLGRVLGVDILSIQLGDGSTPDGLAYIKIDDTLISHLLVELKNEIGEGSCDPGTRAVFSYKRCCQATERAVNHTCCPAFLIHGGGPWLGISGAVFTDKVIVQRLTDMRWFGFSSTEEDVRLWENTRVLLALRETLKQLGDFYKNNLANVPPWTPHNPHPRLYPYPTSYTHEGQEIKFEYREALGDDSKCVTFLARTLGEDPRNIVVKYAANYGESAQRFLASHNYAPKLFYCGPLPDTPESLLPVSPAAENGLPGLCLQPTMFMVVMEYIDAEPLPKIPRKYRTQIEDILVKLHGGGYVFGDLRNQNILIDSKDDSVKLIDFNWSGEYDIEKYWNRLPERVRDVNVKPNAESHGGIEGYAYYPSTLSLSSKIKWPRGVARLEPMLPEHDWDMVDKLAFVSD